MQSVTRFLTLFFVVLLAGVFAGCANVGGLGASKATAPQAEVKKVEEFPTCTSVKGLAYLDPQTTRQVHSGIGGNSFSAHALVFNGLQMTKCFKLIDASAVSSANPAWKIVISISPPNVKAEDKGTLMNNLTNGQLAPILFGLRHTYVASAQVVMTIVDPATGSPVQVIKTGDNKKFGPAAQSLASAGGITEDVSSKSVGFQAVADGVLSAFTAMVSEVEKDVSRPDAPLSSSVVKR